jgi:hypothetical protein
MELPRFAETAAKMSFDRAGHGKRREPPSPTRLRREPSPARGEGTLCGVAVVLTKNSLVRPLSTAGSAG